MPIIPIISGITGAIVGWCTNDAVDETTKTVTETASKTVNYASIAIAGVIAFVVLKQIKVI